jgi:hypothetical protein
MAASLSWQFDYSTLLDLGKDLRRWVELIYAACLDHLEDGNQQNLGRIIPKYFCQSNGSL